MPKIELGKLIEVKRGRPVTARSDRGIYPVYSGNGLHGYHSQYMFENPKIVISCSGHSCGAIHMTSKKSWIIHHAMYVSKLKQPINLIYLEWALRLSDLKNYIIPDLLPRITSSDIYRTEILLPTISQQNEFAALVRHQKVLLSRMSEHSQNIADFGISFSQRFINGQQLFPAK